MTDDTNRCCRDEAFERLAELGLVDDFNEELEWFLAWAERRSGQVTENLVDVLKQIASADLLVDAENSLSDYSATVIFLANRALDKYTTQHGGKNDGRQKSKRG